MRTLPLVALCLLGVVPTRALEDSLVVEVQADGRGTLKLEHVDDARTSALLLDGLDTTQAIERRVQELAAERLCRWRGVAAWTGVVASLTGDRRVRLRATGWFEDLGAVVEQADDEAAGQRFVLERREGELVVTLLEGEPSAPSGPPALSGLLDHGAEGVALLREVTRAMSESLSGWRHERALVMPAPITSHTGFTRVEGPRAERVRDGAALLEALDATYARLEALAGAVERGELTADDAAARLAAERGDEAALVARATLPPEAELAAAAEAFTSAFEGARGAWGSSIWRGRLERWQKRPRPAASPSSGTPADAPADAPAPVAADAAPVESARPAPAKRPARVTRRVRAGELEPNDAPAQAAVVEAGTYLGLELRAEDWFRVDVPTGRELRVTLTFEAAAADLDLAVLAADGATVLAESHGVAGHERVRLVPLAPGPHLLRVHAPPGWAARRPAYRLDVDLPEAAPADRFEPNEPPHPPARLEPGAHAELVCTGDDRYALAVAPGARAELTLTCSPDDGALELALVDAAGRVLARVAATGEATRAACDVPPGGVVAHVAGDERVAYALELVSAAGSPPDAFEPNDAPAAARALAAGAHRDLRLEGEDWFRVDVPADHVLSVTAQVTSAVAGADLDLALHTLEGALLRASAGRGGEERVDLVAGRPRAVLVRVHAARGAGTPPTYALTVTTAARRPADRHEPNDEPAAAVLLAPGRHEGLVCTVEDWYAVALTKGQRLTVTLALEPARGDLDLELCAPEGRVLTGAYGVGAEEAATLVAPADGRYLLRVYRNDAPYALTVAVE